MADTGKAGVSRPVLRLKKEPILEGVTGRGKNAKGIVKARLINQQTVLQGMVEEMVSEDIPLFAGKHLVAIKMFSDSFATSHLPDDLFSKLVGCEIVAPLTSGYLVEVTKEKLTLLQQRIRAADTIEFQVDISRTSSLSIYDGEYVTHGKTITDLWDQSIILDGSHLFVCWLSPFKHSDARKKIAETILGLGQEGKILVESKGDVSSKALTPEVVLGNELSHTDYHASGYGKISISIQNQEDLRLVIASGASYRIDPVKPIKVSKTSIGAEPNNASVTLLNEPIIGLLDGGLTAASYKGALFEKPAEGFVSDSHAHSRHGNQVASVAVNSFEWNSNKHLPHLRCRILPVQVLAKDEFSHLYRLDQLLSYIDGIVSSYPDVYVWNISFNQEADEDLDLVSDLGDSLNKISRDYSVLFIISIGNIRGSQKNLCPPGDCESALVVSGCKADSHGFPSEACEMSCYGSGVAGMLKPDVSWFSSLRVIGGDEVTGTSYAAPLVSNLAAHTYDKLIAPSPDLVKALLIANSNSIEEHDKRLGWGVPYTNSGIVPWVSESDSVTFAWNTSVSSGANHYWDGIPIPKEFIKGNKLAGRASLTAILRPVISPFAGANYFSSRIEVSLQYKNGLGQWKSLLGAMEESTLPEVDARKQLHKWHPIRQHYTNIPRGRGFSGDSFRIYARLYFRDLYLYDKKHHSEFGEQEVAFVLKFWSADGQETIHETMVDLLNVDVESAIIEPEIEIETDV